MGSMPQVDIEQVWEQFARCGDVASRNVLIEHYLPLVKYSAERLSVRFPKSVERDDLHSVGILGLMDAIEKFDPARNVKFETYGVRRIEGTIRDYIRKTDWVPRLVRAQAKRLQAVRQRLESLFGRSPTDIELADELGMDIGRFHAHQQKAAALGLVSLNAALTDDGEGVSGIDMIADQKSQSPFAQAHQRDVQALIKKGLSRPEQLVVILYYYEQMTMKEIGQTLGISESRVCQLHSGILARLREHLNKDCFCESACQTPSPF